MSWQPAISVKRLIISYGACDGAPIADIVTTMTISTSSAAM